MMSRSDYTEEPDDQWALIRWRGAVESAIRGKRGQEFLKDLLKSLDDFPEKALIAEELENDGSYCAPGVLGKSRNMDLSAIDPEDYDGVAKQFGIAPALVREIVFINDDEFSYQGMSNEQRFIAVRDWVKSQIKD